MKTKCNALLEVNGKKFRCKRNKHNMGEEHSCGNLGWYGPEIKIAESPASGK